jgi:hypothetical protein
MIIWNMDYDTAEEYMELARQLESYEISQEDFAERLSFFPGYPLDRLMMPGEELSIKVGRKTQVGFRKDH